MFILLPILMQIIVSCLNATFVCVSDSESAASPSDETIVTVDKTVKPVIPVPVWDISQLSAEDQSWVIRKKDGYYCGICIKSNSSKSIALSSGVHGYWYARPCVNSDMVRAVSKHKKATLHKMALSEEVMIQSANLQKQATELMSKKVRVFSKRCSAVLFLIENRMALSKFPKLHDFMETNGSYAGLENVLHGGRQLYTSRDFQLELATIIASVVRFRVTEGMATSPSRISIVCAKSSKVRIDSLAPSTCEILFCEDEDDYSLFDFDAEIRRSPWELVSSQSPTSLLKPISSPLLSLSGDSHELQSKSDSSKIKDKSSTSTLQSSSSSKSSKSSKSFSSLLSAKPSKGPSQSVSKYPNATSTESLKFPDFKPVDFNLATDSILQVSLNAAEIDPEPLSRKSLNDALVTVTFLIPLATALIYLNFFFPNYFISIIQVV
jgi:hypothetical protein